MAARRLLDAKHRHASGAALVEGPHAIEVALSSGVALRELFVTETFAADQPRLLADTQAAGGQIRLVTDQVLGRLAETRTPQGAVAVVAPPRGELPAVLAARPALLTMLVECADPGNLGTVARTADAAGAGAVLVTSGSADPWSGKAIRASAGSLLALPVVDRLAPLPAIGELRAGGWQVLATTAEGDSDLDELIDTGALGAPTVWLFGNEARGLPVDVAAAADRSVRIPMAGRAESLNLAAAAAVCLFASARAQRSAGAAPD